MSAINFAQLQEQLEAALANEGVVVYYHPHIETNGEYLDNGTIFINSKWEGNEEETLKITTHETVHHLQFTRGILKGTQPPSYWDSRFSPEQDQIILELCQEEYDPKDWEIEIPAWTLQYSPTEVLAILLNK